MVTCFQPLSGQGEQLRAGLQIPVGGLGAGMAEEGGQHRQACLHVGAILIPADQDIHREGVPQIVDSGAAPPRWCADAGLDQQFGEGLLWASPRIVEGSSCRLAGGCLIVDR